MAEDQRYDSLPTIQIIIYIRERLAQYYAKVKGSYQDILEILDLDLEFTGCCPICGGRGCTAFIGYYYRKVIDGSGNRKGGKGSGGIKKAPDPFPAPLFLKLNIRDTPDPFPDP